MNLKLKITIAIVVIVILILLFVLYKTHKRRDTEPFRLENDTSRIPVKTPTDIKLTVNGTSIHAAWPDVTNAEEYTVYYSNQSDFTKETARTISGIDKGEFSINKVPVGKYYFRVTSKNRTNESAWSDLLSVEITACTPLDPPRNVQSKITEATEKSFTSLISWQPEMTSDGYVIRLQHGEPPKGDESDYMIIPVQNVDASSHVLEGLDAKIQWFVTISCNGGHCGEGKRSDPITLN